MCYPNSVLIHIRLRGLTAEQTRALAEAPGLTCHRIEDDLVRARIEVAHGLPTWPDLDALQGMVREMVGELVPEAEVVDIRAGYRYDSDADSPAEPALHRLRSVANQARGEIPDGDRDELLTSLLRDFTVVDNWLSQGGSLPPDWARRHPAGDHSVARRLVEGASAMLAGTAG